MSSPRSILAVTSHTISDESPDDPFGRGDRATVVVAIVNTGTETGASVEAAVDVASVQLVDATAGGKVSSHRRAESIEMRFTNAPVELHYTIEARELGHRGRLTRFAFGSRVVRGCALGARSPRSPGNRCWSRCFGV